MNSKKNILILTTIGGFLQKFEMNDVRMLQLQGWKVHYASNFLHPVYDCNVKALEEQGICCHQIPIEKYPFCLFSNFKALYQILDIIRNEKIIAIHCHNPMGGVLGRIASLFLSEKLYVIYTAHGFHFYKSAPIKNWILYYPIERFLAHFTNQIITINDEDEKNARKFRLHIGGTRTRIPGVGFNKKRFHEDRKEGLKLRREYGLDDNVFLMLSVGELNQNKNHAVVIQALASIKNIIDERMDLFYMICGEGPYRNKLEIMIKENKLENCVKLCGYQNQIERFYQAADCFLFPSYREGLGMAAIEAMACRLPLIVSDNRGTREYSVNNVNAFICQADDTEAFANAILKMWMHPLLRKDMGKKSKVISEKFEIERTEKIMKKVYIEMEQKL